MHIQGQIVDIENKRIYSGEVTVSNGKIISVTEKNHEVKNYILPGFIDGHIHMPAGGGFTQPLSVSQHPMPVHQP